MRALTSCRKDEHCLLNVTGRPSDMLRRMSSVAVSPPCMDLLANFANFELAMPLMLLMAATNELGGDWAEGTSKQKKSTLLCTSSFPNVVRIVVNHVITIAAVLPKRRRKPLFVFKFFI